MWDKATVDAWKWMWEIVHVVFKHHMETSNVMLQYLKESWDIIEEEELAVIIAEKFYSTLFRIGARDRNVSVEVHDFMAHLLARAGYLGCSDITDFLLHRLHISISSSASAHVH